MNRAVWFALVFASGCGGSYVPGSGTGFGEGRCDLGTDIAAVKAETTFCAPNAPPAPSICSKPLCYGPLGSLLPRVGFQSGATQGDELPCQPTDGTDVVDKQMLSSVLQKAKLRHDGEFYSSCKAPDRCTGTKADCKFMMASPKACSPLAYVDAFVAEPTVSFDMQGLMFKTPYGGSTHDGDEAFNAAPFAMGAQGINGDPASRHEMDLRPVEQVRGADRYTAVHVEAPWCRWYGAPVLVEPQYDGDTGSFFCSFRPRQGERVSAAGDWVVENVDVEIHDARASSPRSVLTAQLPTRTSLKPA